MVISRSPETISDKLLHWIRGVCAVDQPWCSPLPVSSHSQWVPADQPSAQPGPLDQGCLCCRPALVTCNKKHRLPIMVDSHQPAAEQGARSRLASSLLSYADQRMLTLTTTNHIMSSLSLQFTEPYRFDCNWFHTLVMRLESRSLT